MARAGLRRLPVVAGGARRLDVGRAGATRRQTHRHDLSQPVAQLAAGAGRAGRAGGAEWLGGNRPSPRPGRRDLRPGLQRRNPGRKPVEAGPRHPAERSSAGRTGATVRDIRAELADLLLRRMDGVLRIRDSKLLMFQAPRDALDQLLLLLPDAEPPTMCAIDGADTLSLQALCHGAMTWQRLEDLKRAGARGLMVLPVERMLA